MCVLYDVSQLSALLPTLARIPVSSIHVHVHLCSRFNTTSRSRVDYRVTVNFNLTAAMAGSALKRLLAEYKRMLCSQSTSTVCPNMPFISELTLNSPEGIVAGNDV